MAKFTMYLLVILFRMLLGRDDAGSWCLQLVRRDGRSETRPWSGLFLNFVANCWAELELRTRRQPRPSPSSRRSDCDSGPDGSHNRGRDVDRGRAGVRARIAFLRRRRD